MAKKKRAQRPAPPKGLPAPPDGATADPVFYEGTKVWFYDVDSGQWLTGTIISPPDGSSGSTMMPWIEVDGTWEQVPKRIEYVYGFIVIVKGPSGAHPWDPSTFFSSMKHT
ncbi:hypothetical protein F52700_4594 [Fusarium sp. NRRL 52700]|nr:hypothetical protein F52700_4594 [Fusarium sp. NRRL 52700]